MTEADIQRLLATTLFHYRKCICVPNVDWGFLPWEADLCVLHASGWMDEVEIKTSAADLRADRKKLKHRHPSAVTHKIRKFYYCAPRRVLEAVDLGEVITNGEGIIVVDGDAYPGCVATVIRPAKNREHSRQLTAEEKLKLARLGCMRYWCRRV